MASEKARRFDHAKSGDEQLDEEEPEHRSGARLRPIRLRPRDRTHEGARPSAVHVLPDEILLLSDGQAITSYQGEPLFRYASLDELLADHGLTRADLERF